MFSSLDNSSNWFKSLQVKDQANRQLWNTTNAFIPLDNSIAELMQRIILKPTLFRLVLFGIDQRLADFCLIVSLGKMLCFKSLIMRIE